MKLPGTPTQRKWAQRVAIVAVIAAGYYLFTQVLDLEKILEDVSKALGAWTYALVGFFAFAETGAFIGLIAPGETVMLLGGAVAGQGTINLYVLIALAWTMAQGTVPIPGTRRIKYLEENAAAADVTLSGADLQALDAAAPIGAAAGDRYAPAGMTSLNH